MIFLEGKGISDGVALGPLRFFRRETAGPIRTEADDPQAEWNRFLEARRQATGQLGALAEKARREAGEEAAALFETHQLMAEDPDFEEAVEEAIQKKGRSAEAAVREAAERFAEAFSAMEDEYMRQRAADIRDVSERIVSVLTGRGQAGFSSDEPVILAADDLAPSETIQLDRSKILGIVTSGGSASGHTAILARTMGVAAIAALGDALREEYEGQLCAIDGSTGEMIVAPDEAEQRRMTKRRETQAAGLRELDALRGLPNETKDGQRIRVYCNIGAPEEAAAVRSGDGDGVGLFRSEFLYLGRSALPTEEEQLAAYADVLRAMDGGTVVIRTLDIGADKQLEALRLPREENPAMGLRGLRLCLTRSELLKTQLRALFRAAVYGRLGVMFPMVTSVWEVREAKALCEEVKAELEREGIPFGRDVELGVMIETPAAAILSDKLAEEVDFFSCGTNDLTQYTLACDRQNGALGRFYDPHHPALLRLLRQVVESAHRRGIWVGVCGELAADPEMTEVFLALGVDELSVSPRAVLPLRRRIRETELRERKQEILQAIMDGEA